MDYFFSQELRSFSQEKKLSSFVIQSSSLFSKAKYVEENMQETWSSFTMLEITSHQGKKQNFLKEIKEILECYSNKQHKRKTSIH